MKISCGVIKDLLPLYHDGVCSDESKAMVEEHLASCDDCQSELLAMDDALNINPTAHHLKEAETLRKLSRRWKKGMFKSLLKGVFFTISTIVLMLLFLYLFMDFKVVSKS